MRKKILFFSLILLFLLICFLAREPILHNLASRLIVQDELGKSDLIIVLGGDNNGERVREGVILFRAGYAPKMLLSGGPMAWKLIASDHMKKQAVSFGVPEEAIILERKSISTYENAKLSLEIIKNKEINSVIVVTSPFHTRRAKRVFTKVFGDYKISVQVYPVQESKNKVSYWWTRNDDLWQVLQEYIKTFAYRLKGYI